MAVAISFHLGLLMMVLAPASHWTDDRPATNRETTSLELRIISPVGPAPVALAHRTVTTKAPTLLPLRVVPRAPVHTGTASGHEPPTTIATTPESVPATIRQEATVRASGGDGGFQQRLLDAQHGRAIPGIPGSDNRIAPGVQLTDPMDQGVGAILRNTQRLFGVTNHHCIDVEVWQSLTPAELAARHLSPADVQKESDKYACNKPLGLSF
ncbi:hypothetical protein [Luteibacter sp. HA06]